MVFPMLLWRWKHGGGAQLLPRLLDNKPFISGEPRGTSHYCYPVLWTVHSMLQAVQHRRNRKVRRKLVQVLHGRHWLQHLPRPTPCLSHICMPQEFSSFDELLRYFLPDRNEDEYVRLGNSFRKHLRRRKVRAGSVFNILVEDGRYVLCSPDGTVEVSDSLISSEKANASVGQTVGNNASGHRLP